MAQPPSAVREELLTLRIRFPIFVRTKDSGTLKKYSSLEVMQRDLEEIDIENDEYEAWDANGVYLSLSVQQPIWLRVDAGPAKPEGLAAAINDFAQRFGIAPSSALSPGEFESAVDEIELQLAAVRQSGSWLRRLLKTK